MEPRKLAGMTVQFITTLVALAVLFLTVHAIAQEIHEVRPGSVIATDRAILCADLDSAKKLADTIGSENVEQFGQGLLKSGSCVIANGVMQVKGLAYQGKTFNVISTHDNAHQFYWVTIVKVKGTEV